MYQVILTAAMLQGAARPPPLPDVSADDLRRFPPREVAAGYRSLAALHQQWVGERIQKIEPYTNKMTGQVDGGDSKFYGSQWEAAESCRTARAWLLEYRKWQADQQTRYEAWDSLDKAHWRHHHSGLLRDLAPLADLNELRRRIGPAAYAAGRMPCPVPLDRLALLH